MVICDLKDSARLEALHPLFKLAFDYLKSHNFLEMPLGKIEIKGDELFINNAESELRTKEAQQLEMHRRYIDIHVPLDGEEIIGWTPTADLDEADTTKPYDEAKDVATSKGPVHTYFVVRPGQMVIDWPEDAHAPIIGEGKLRKAIVKIKL